MTALPSVSDLPHVGTELLSEILDPARTALVLVDVQVDFVSPDGVIGQAGVDLRPAHIAMAQMARLREALKQKGGTICFLKVVTRDETDTDALKNLYAWRGKPGQHAICRVDEAGSDYYQLVPEDGDLDIAKVLFDGFHGTELDAELKARGIDTVLMAGVTTDCCVDQTARSAFHHNFNVVVVSDACAAYEEILHVGALMALEKNCALLADTQTVLDTLEG